jgi:predicted CXXCH cytochrome family protein
MFPARRRRASLRTAVAVAVLAGASLVAGTWTGCTVTPGNYRTLSFFFDGVPDPSPGPAGGARGEDRARTPALVVVHRPYAEDKCESCHTTRFRPSRHDSGACMQCHAPVRTAHPRMHGPVSAGACLWCHSPHESSHAFLMRDADRKVCAQCHSGATFDTSRVAAHADATRGCLECHVAHGGDRPFLLRPGASRDTPPPPPPLSQGAP